jgi:hypothetical protein
VFVVSKGGYAMPEEKGKEMDSFRTYLSSLSKELEDGDTASSHGVREEFDQESFSMKVSNGK